MSGVVYTAPGCRSEKVMVGAAGDAGDLDWAVDQIALARLDAASARLTGRAERSTSGFALFEAAEIARDRGVPDLAEAAEALIPVRSINV